MPIAEKHRAISRQEKMAIFTSHQCLGTPFHLPQSLYGRHTLTSQPKFLRSIGYQICLAMVLRWRASARANIVLVLSPVFKEQDLH